MGRDNGFLLGSKETRQSQKPKLLTDVTMPKMIREAFLSAGCASGYKSFPFSFAKGFFLNFFSFLVGKISFPVRVAQLSKKKASLQILRDPGCAKGLHLASALRATRVLQSQGCA